MGSNKKIIYSKRYPVPEWGDRAELGLDLRHLAELEKIHVPMPEWIEKGRRAMERARGFSEGYEYDIDIVEDDYHIDIILYMDSFEEPIGFAGELGGIIAMCDAIALCVPAGGGKTIGLILRVHTHDCYLAGGSMDR